MSVLTSLLRGQWLLQSRDRLQIPALVSIRLMIEFAHSIEEAIKLTLDRCWRVG